MSDDLLAATTRLSGKVDELTESIRISALQAKRNKALMRVVIGLLALCALGLIVTGYLFVQVNDTTALNKHNQVITCQNSNDARSANLTLWTFLISQSKADTPKEALALQKLQSYIDILYSPHDCSNLSKKYPLPEPPDLGLN